MNETLAPANTLIIVVTVLVSLGGLRSAEFLGKYLFAPRPILDHGEYYRLITSGFLHAGWAHLFFNMYSLYSFGAPVERALGAADFIAIYFAGIVGGNLVSLFLHRGDDYYRALGASGGVCGIIFAAIFLMPGGMVYVFPIPVAIPSPVYAILFIAISFFGIRSGMGRIGHDAHLGGAIIGLLVATAIAPDIVSRSRNLYAIVMGISCVLFVYLYLANRRPPSRAKRW
jgi:membrane associated rhomboid family serine protease